MITALITRLAARRIIKAIFIALAKQYVISTKTKVDDKLLKAIIEALS